MTTDAVARLREQVRRLERRSLPHSHTDTLPTGHSAVDDHLGGGLKTGSLHDFLISDPLEIGASLAMLLPILQKGRGPVFWISDTPAELNAWGLHQSGVPLDHLVRQVTLALRRSYLSQDVVLVYGRPDGEILHPIFRPKLASVLI